MDLKKLIVILIVVCVIIVGAIYIYTNFANSDSEIKDNITNISSNMTDDVVNATLVVKVTPQAVVLIQNMVLIVMLKDGINHNVMGIVGLIGMTNL